MIMLDTHVLVWLDEGSFRLGPESRSLIDQALACGRLTVSAVSFWEIAMLVEKKRLEIRMNLQSWRIELLENGLNEIGLNGFIAIRAGALTSFHGDPADRMIVSSALENSATLVTADEKILAWSGLAAKHDACT
ncbi:MAG: type II toxin-antitoxin system VapC family toxin [Pontiellaceae bacterium]|nr:type II toxin-antitoxin system VapC family toxin [Candidatus Anaeroferrophillacea bacterium]MBN2785792.1 type II toxin-antitoxin system VapC family toxin [Pontiellaceae bacterium]